MVDFSQPMLASLLLFSARVSDNAPSSPQLLNSDTSLQPVIAADQDVRNQFVQPRLSDIQVRKTPLFSALKKTLPAIEPPTPLSQMVNALPECLKAFPNEYALGGFRSRNPDFDQDVARMTQQLNSLGDQALSRQTSVFQFPGYYHNSVHLPIDGQNNGFYSATQANAAHKGLYLHDQEVRSTVNKPMLEAAQAIISEKGECRIAVVGSGFGGDARDFMAYVMQADDSLASKCQLDLYDLSLYFLDAGAVELPHLMADLGLESGAYEAFSTLKSHAYEPGTQHPNEHHIGYRNEKSPIQHLFFKDVSAPDFISSLKEHDVAPYDLVLCSYVLHEMPKTIIRRTLENLVQLGDQPTIFFQDMDFEAKMQRLQGTLGNPILATVFAATEPYSQSPSSNDIPFLLAEYGQLKALDQSQVTQQEAAIQAFKITPFSAQRVVVPPNFWESAALSLLSAVGGHWPGDQLVRDPIQIQQLEALCPLFRAHLSDDMKAFVPPAYCDVNKFHGIHNNEWWSVANQASAMQALTSRIDQIESVPVEQWVDMSLQARLSAMIAEFVNLAYDAAEQQLGRAPQSIVDIGCGTGETLKGLEQIARQRAYDVKTAGVLEIFGVDPFEKMLAYFCRQEGYGRQDILQDRMPVKLRLGAMENLPFKNDSVDVATLYAVSHEMPTRDFIKAVRHTYQKLSPNGVLMIVDLDPNQGLPSMMKQLPSAISQPILSTLVLEPFIDQYLKRDEIKILERMGFDVKQQTLGSNRILLATKVVSS